jgi:hypothetical protein
LVMEVWIFSSPPEFWQNADRGTLHSILLATTDP